jgi:hypothetical protein
MFLPLVTFSLPRASANARWISDRIDSVDGGADCDLVGDFFLAGISKSPEIQVVGVEREFSFALRACQLRSQ